MPKVCGSRLLVAKDGTWYLPGERGGAGGPAGPAPAGAGLPASQRLPGRAWGRRGCATFSCRHCARQLLACLTLSCICWLTATGAACDLTCRPVRLLPRQLLAALLHGKPVAGLLCSTSLAGCLPPSPARSAPRARGELAHLQRLDLPPAERGAGAAAGCAAQLGAAGGAPRGRGCAPRCCCRDLVRPAFATHSAKNTGGAPRSRSGLAGRGLTSRTPAPTSTPAATEHDHRGVRAGVHRRGRQLGGAGRGGGRQDLAGQPGAGGGQQGAADHAVPHRGGCALRRRPLLPAHMCCLLSAACFLVGACSFAAIWAGGNDCAGLAHGLHSGMQLAAHSRAEDMPKSLPTCLAHLCPAHSPSRPLCLPASLQARRT